MKEYIGAEPIDYIKDTAKKFIDRETFGGLLLIVATIVAVGIMNSPWEETFEHFWEQRYIIAGQNFRFEKSLHEWINDGLMVIFFFVVGLELKRELLVGELSDIQKSSLPIFAAVGGMAFPAIIFFMFNKNGPDISGWAIPMATDIAYSLGIISLLGRRVPQALKVFLVALAIVDDIGAILIIAIFYSFKISWFSLGIAGVIMILLVSLNLLGVRSILAYILLGICLWVAFLTSGVHTTIAGVLLAMTIPVKVKLKSNTFKEKTEQKLQELEQTEIKQKNTLTDRNQLEIVEQIKSLTKQARSPLLRLENALSGFNAFFIIPVFALANAGVTFQADWTTVFTAGLGQGIVGGLLLGKVLGVSIFSWLAIKLRLARLPMELNYKAIIGVGLLAGIGFTMSLFITELAFHNARQVVTSKIAILLASFVAAVIGLLVLYMAYHQGANDQRSSRERSTSDNF